MKKILVVAFALTLFCTTATQAQTYKTALGLGIDFGDGATLVGPTIKHFFKENHAVEGDVLFGGRSTFIQAFYQYHQDFPNAKNLQWYLGGGPSLQLYSGGSSFYLRPMAGLDYKINDVPLALSFDWRPLIYLGNNSFGSRFTAARFGLGFKYVLN